MSEKYEGWSIVELMGHRRLAGYIREQEVAGVLMLRIDIPSDPPATQFYSPSSLYCLTPTTEEIVRALAKRVGAAPVHAWELPALQKPPVEDEDYDDDD